MFPLIFISVICNDGYQQKEFPIDAVKTETASVLNEYFGIMD